MVKTYFLKLFLAVCIVLLFFSGTVGESVYAVEDETSQAETIEKTVSDIEQLPKNIQAQSFTWPASSEEIILPEKLTTDRGELDVTWVADRTFDGKKPGSYVFKPEFAGGYTADVPLPQIKVTVASAVTKVTGISLKRSAKAGTALTDAVTISPAYGGKVYLQQKSGSKWITRRIISTANQEVAKVTLRYTKDWYAKESSSWRVYVPARTGASGYRSGTIHVTAKRVYQNPRKYLQIKQTVTVKASGAYKLRRGTMGLKVARVQRKLGMGRRWEIMDSSTIYKVKAFQRKKKLKATGVVDYKTWKKMGFSKASWSSQGKYVSPVRVKMTSTRKQCIDTMISTAKKYRGDEYIVGAAGKPGSGADCSGLVIQSLYSAGLNPAPVSVVRHAQPGYEYESRNLWKHKKLKHVPYAKKQRGDLIFYRGRGGAIIHVAIYLGKGKVIESWPDKVRVWPVKNSRRSRIAGVIRPFV